MDNISKVYDIRLYPDCEPLDDFKRKTQEMEKFIAEFQYFRDRMLPDIYNKIYDLQMRYNNMDILLRECNTALDKHIHPGD